MGRHCEASVFEVAVEERLGHRSRRAAVTVAEAMVEPTQVLWPTQQFIHRQCRLDIGPTLVGVSRVARKQQKRPGRDQGKQLVMLPRKSRLPDFGAEIPNILPVAETQADAALAASIFHYGIESLEYLKRFLLSLGIPVRLPC